MKFYFIFLLGVLKCKKDKAYENGQLCPNCAYPKQFQKQDVQHLKDISCSKPVIQSPLKKNISFNTEGAEDDDYISQPPLEEFQMSPWNITLNLTDEHGNVVNLNCEIKKPTNSTKIQWNQISPQEIDVNATISLDLECPMNRDNYEKLWKLIAYYSEVPVKLEREHVISPEPKKSYHYRQGSDYDALYYTGVKGRIFAEPAWVMQPLIHIQLNRRQSTGNKVVLSFSTHISQTLQTQENRQQRSSWVMIEQDRYTKAAQSVVEGSDVQLSCNVRASESPSIQWMLPDGTKLKAPFKMDHNRFSVLSSGQLIIKSVGYADSGMYHCVVQVRGDVDTISHRVLVQPPVIQPADSDTMKVEKNVGDTIILPCSAEAMPDAHLSWILPNSHVLNDLSNSSNGYMLDNGTLLIPHSRVSDSGYYRCVAINQQGSDQFAVGVTVNKMVSDRSSKRVKFKKHPESRTFVKTKGQFIEDDDGSGASEIDDIPNKRIHLKDHEVPLKQKNDKASRAQAKKNRKGKRKMKLWKGMDRTEEINVAEGRRVFESRRRINMANKQINPQHWANILAKVRGKSLPRTTTAPVSPSETTTETTFTYKTTRTTPIASPPSKTVVESPINAEESSADIPHFSEAQLLTVPPIITSQEQDPIEQDPSTVASTEPEPSVEHEFPRPEEAWHSVGTPVAQDTNIFATVQSPAWDHSDLRTEYSLAAPTSIDAFTRDPSNEHVTSHLPLFQSTLRTVDSGATTTQSMLFSTELPLEVPLFVEIQGPEGPEIDLQKNYLNNPNKDAYAVHSTQFQNSHTINSIATTTIFAPVPPVKDSVLLETSGVEHQQIKISSDPYRGSDSIIFENIHVSNPESTSAVKTTTTPVQQKEWIMTAATTNKPITAYERKITSSNSQVIPQSRRRQYGRRRLRPNRFRRPKPTASATEEIPFIQNITTLEVATQSLLGSILKELDVETQNTNEYKTSKVRSSLTTSTNTLQRSPKVQGMEASLALRFTTALPKTLVTLSNNVNDQKNGITISAHDMLTTNPNVERHLSHRSEHQLMTSTDSESIRNVASNAVATSYEVTDAQTTSTSMSIGSSTGSVSHSTFSYSVIPEFEKEFNPIASSAPENGVTIRVPQSRSSTAQPLPAIDGTMEHFKNHQTLSELQKLSLSLTTLAPAFHQRETVTLPQYSNLFTLSEPKQVIKPWHERTHIITSSRHTKENTPLNNNQDQTSIRRTEKIYSPVLPIAPAPLATILPPSVSSRPRLSDHSKKENYTSVHPTSPEIKGSSVDTLRAKVSSKNELFPSHSHLNKIATQQKQETYSGKTHNSLPLNPNVPHQPIGLIPVFRQPPAFVPPKQVPVRGTAKPPRLLAPGFFHYFVTPGVPLHYTNKPEITAYAAQTTQGRKTTTPHTETFPTTTATPLYRPKLHTPVKPGNQGETRFNTHSHVFANYLPDSRDKPGRTIINQAVPYFPNPRTPFLYNRTRVFPHLGINSKQVLPHWQVPVSTTEKKISSLTRTVTQSTSLRIAGIVPPLSTAIPAVTTPAFVTPSFKSQKTSTSQASRSIHFSNPNVLFGPKVGIKALNSSVIQPSTHIRIQGGRPKIISKGSNSLSILAESDAVIPCDATGDPKPFLSWTKLSTGKIQELLMMESVQNNFGYNPE